MARAPGLGSLFFFQAEDGIRELIVTGVQTCALPILCGSGNIGTSWFPDGPAVSSAIRTSICWPVGTVTCRDGTRSTPAQSPTDMTCPSTRTQAGVEQVVVPLWYHHGLLAAASGVPACVSPQEPSRPAAAIANAQATARRRQV